MSSTFIRLKRKIYFCFRKGKEKLIALGIYVNTYQSNVVGVADERVVKNDLSNI